jgi:hypothetical protein
MANLPTDREQLAALKESLTKASGGKQLYHYHHEEAGDFIFCVPKEDVLDEFLGGETTNSQMEQSRCLARECVVWPAKAELNLVFECYPAVADPIAVAIGRKAGLDRKANAKKF